MILTIHLFSLFFIVSIQVYHFEDSRQSSAVPEVSDLNTACTYLNPLASVSPNRLSQSSDRPQFHS